MRKIQTIEKAITERFLQVMADHVGPGKLWKFKKDFATAMGIRQQELTKIENGTVQLRHLYKIEELTSASMDWLICGKGDKYKLKKDTIYNGLQERLEAVEKIVLKYLAK